MTNIVEEYQAWLVEQQELEESGLKDAAVAVGLSAVAASAINSVPMPKPHELHKTLQSVHTMVGSGDITKAREHIKSRNHGANISVDNSGIVRVGHNAPGEAGEWWKKSPGEHLANRIKNRVTPTKGAPKGAHAERQFQKHKIDFEKREEDHDRINGKGSYRKKMRKWINGIQSKRREKI